MTYLLNCKVCGDSFSDYREETILPNYFELFPQDFGICFECETDN